MLKLKMDFLTLTTNNYFTCVFVDKEYDALRLNYRIKQTF